MQSGLKDKLSARLKAAERCDTRANGVGGVALSAGAASDRILSNRGGAAISTGAVSNAGDLGDASTDPRKRPRAGGLEGAPNPKRPRTLPLDMLLELFIAAALDSSVVLVRCGERQVGGECSGASSLSVQAGELFEVEVRIKTRFATFDSELAEQMMRKIVLLPDAVLISEGEPRFSPETGVAFFPVRAEKAGDIAISAAVVMPTLYRLQQGAAAPQTYSIGGMGGVMQLKVLPGALQFQSMMTKKDVLGEQVEFELGEQVELMLQFGHSDQFGNLNPLPHTEASLANLVLECTWIHQDVAAPLHSLQLSFTTAGVAVRGIHLSLLGKHEFQIKFVSQVFAATVQVVPGMPHLLQWIGEGRSHVLRQWRWGCKARLLNKHGHPAIFSKDDFPVISVQLVPSQSPVGQDGLPLEAKLSEHAGSIKGCSLADAHTIILVQELEIFHIETSVPACKGEYRLQAKVEGQSGALACDSATICLGLPLDPSSWDPHDLAESIRLSSVEVPGDFPNNILKDEFGDAVSGKDLVVRGKDILIECLLHHQKFSNRQEKDHASAWLKQVADGIIEKNTLAKLGKGKFKSSVAKCISEGDLRYTFVTPCRFLSLPRLLIALLFSFSAFGLCHWSLKFLNESDPRCMHVMCFSVACQSCFC